MLLLAAVIAVLALLPTMANKAEATPEQIEESRLAFWFLVFVFLAISSPEILGVRIISYPEEWVLVVLRKGICRLEKGPIHGLKKVRCHLQFGTEKGVPQLPYEMGRFLRQIWEKIKTFFGGGNGMYLDPYTLPFDNDKGHNSSRAGPGETIRLGIITQ